MTAGILIFGAGYSGRAFAAGNNDLAISGTTRAEDGFDRLSAAGIRPFLFDGHRLTPELDAELGRARHLIVSIAPGEAGDPVLNAAQASIRRTSALASIAYLSTVGVYGDHGGAWVDEASPCRPVSARSRRRVEAEARWLALGDACDIPVAVLRLSGIYGPGRNAFVNLAQGTAKRWIKPGQVFNRIHVDDIAGALRRLIEIRYSGLVNVTDDLPAPPQDVVGLAAELMGVPPPPAIPFEAAQLSPMARSFYGENKRVSNQALKAAGYDLRYPDFRTALGAMWREGSWRGDQVDRRSAMTGN
jgi:hypothetical protein